MLCWNSMNKYSKSFLVVAIFFSLPSLFSLILQLVSFHSIQPEASMIILWWGMYFYLKTGEKMAFGLSFLLINSYWWPLLFKSVRTIFYVIKNGADAWGSAHHIFEIMLTVPLTVALIFGLFVLKSFKKSSPLTVGRNEST